MGRLATKAAGPATAEPGVSFERLSFRSGHFVNARFAPDGETVFLSADWDRNEREVTGGSPIRTSRRTSRR